ncbi:hypothetical protein L9F63_021842, partial [Diploptera punctata]
LLRERIAIEKLSEVVNAMLCDSDCSELSWNEDSNNEIIYRKLHINVVIVLVRRIVYQMIVFGSITPFRNT